ncbi:MAG: hypothetical protein AAFR16_12930 [Pseudomonadota bacterium]
MSERTREACERRRARAAAEFAAANGWTHAHCFGAAELRRASAELTVISADAYPVPGVGADADRFRDARRRAVCLVGHVVANGRGFEEIEAECERALLAMGLKLTVCRLGPAAAWRPGRLPVALTRIDVDPAFPQAAPQAPARAPQRDRLREHERRARERELEQLLSEGAAPAESGRGSPRRAARRAIRRQVA